MRARFPNYDQSSKFYFDREIEKTLFIIDKMSSPTKIEGALNHLERKINEVDSFLELEMNMDLLVDFNKTDHLYNKQHQVRTAALVDFPKFKSSKGLWGEDKMLHDYVKSIREKGGYDAKHLKYFLRNEIKKSKNKKLAKFIYKQIKGRSDQDTLIQFLIYTVNLYQANIYAQRLYVMREEFLMASKVEFSYDIDDEVFKLLSSPNGFKITWNNDLAALAYMFKRLTQRDADKYAPKQQKRALEATNDELIVFICQNFTHKGQPIKPGAIADYIKKNKAPSKTKNNIDIDVLLEET